MALGSVAWAQLYRAAAALGLNVPRPRPRFGHRAEATLLQEASVSTEGNVPVVGSYHPSQQNTFTGRLTESMFDSVWKRARELADG